MWIQYKYAEVNNGKMSVAGGNEARIILDLGTIGNQDFTILILVYKP